MKIAAANQVFNIRRNHRISKDASEKMFAVCLVLPAVALLCITIIIPLFRVIGMSFFNYNLMNMNNIVWNNFANYKSLFSNSEFVMAFLRTIVYVGCTVFFQFFLGLGIAMLLNKDIKGKGFLRGLLFLPWTIPTIVTALVWMWICQPQYGVLNYILTSFGIIDHNINWLADLKTAMPMVIVASVWKQMPLMMVMLLAAVQTVPKELEEAAIIDGAGGFKKFINVTIPCIMSVIKTVTLTSIITNFQMFALFYTMTGGGPIKATTTLTVFTYETAFMAFDFGKGASIGVLWMMFLILFSTVYNKLLSKNEAYS